MTRKINKAVFLLESQPPHIGEVLSVLSVIDEYEFLYICVSNRATVLPILHVIKIWEQLLKAYDKKIAVCSEEWDFVTSTNLPEKFKDCAIFTVSQKIYANLSIGSLPVELVATAIGYETIFEASAFKKGRAYHYIKSKSYLKNGI